MSALQLGVVARGGAAEPERGAGLVHGAVGLGPAARLRHAAAVPEAGRAVVALARVDLGHSSGLKTKPVGILG